MSYSAKIRVALACGLSKDLKKSLNAVGYLRNDFAHESDRQITDADVEKLSNSLRPKDAKLVETYAAFPSEKELEERNTTLQKEKIALSLTVVWMSLIKKRKTVPGS